MAKAKKTAVTPEKSGPAIYTVPLSLGDKELTLEFNYRAYLAMFDWTGIDLLDAWEPSKLSLQERVMFVMASAMTHHVDLDLDWWINQLRGNNMARVLDAAFAAYSKSLPDPDPSANPQMPVK